MMEDVAAKVAGLRARADQARDARVRAEQVRDQAQQAVDRAVQALRDEFGVETPEQVQALAADLDREITAEAQKIEQALGSVGL